MGFMRPTRVEYSLDEVIENMQKESAAAILTARAALGDAEAHRKLDVPRRFPDVSPEALTDLSPEVDERGARGRGSHSAQPV